MGVISFHLFGISIVVLCLQEEELYQLFCGSDVSASTVEAIRVIRDPHTSLGKGIAYILFKTLVCLTRLYPNSIFFSQILCLYYCIYSLHKLVMLGSNTVIEPS